jgi:hypothetical protein
VEVLRHSDTSDDKGQPIAKRHSIAKKQLAAEKSKKLPKGNIL